MPALSRALDRSLRLRPAWLWLLAAAVALGFAAAAARMVWRVRAADRPEFAPMRAAKVAAGRSWVIAGSGSNVPVIQLVVAGCGASDRSLAIGVDVGMGSTGGLRALADGAIDAALVSRPLHGDELRPDWLRIDYLDAPVAFAVHPAVAATELTADQAVAIYRGQQAAWPDGTALVVVQRERGDSSHAAAEAALDGFAAANRDAYAAQRFRIAYSDRSMHDALLSTPGAIGLVDVTAVNASHVPLKLLQLAGRVAPLQKTHAAVVAAARRDELAPLIRCLFSPPAQDEMRRAGGRPLLEPRP